MDFDKRIPILIKVQDEIDFGNKSFDMPQIIKCSHCGSNIFYIGEYYGLHKRDWEGLFDDVKVLGETEESKEYRRWEITVVGERKYCAVCGCKNGYITVWDEKEIAHEFEDEYEKGHYEEALDLIKYPESPQKERLINYDSAIKDIKKWVADWKKKQDIKKKKK